MSCSVTAIIGDNLTLVFVFMSVCTPGVYRCDLAFNGEMKMELVDETGTCRMSSNAINTSLVPLRMKEASLALLLSIVLGI